MSAPVHPAADLRGKPLGLPQPEIANYRPSKTTLWYGDRDGVDQLTKQQRHACAMRGVDADDAERQTVRRYASQEEHYWPVCSWNPKALPRPFFEFQCPILQRRADGRIKVIAPNGDAALVREDGWALPNQTKKDHRSARQAMRSGFRPHTV